MNIGLFKILVMITHNPSSYLLPKWYVVISRIVIRCVNRSRSFHIITFGSDLLVHLIFSVYITLHWQTFDLYTLNNGIISSRGETNKLDEKGWIIFCCKLWQGLCIRSYYGNYFKLFDPAMEKCFSRKSAIAQYMSCNLEGLCVVISEYWK
mgnify:CR=1 FL=1